MGVKPQNALEIGDVFKCPKIPEIARYGHTRADDDKPMIDRSRLEMDHGTVIHFNWHQTRPNGWQRTVGVRLDMAIDDPTMKDAEWVVTETKITGGGTAMVNDVYPDGWQVTAQRLDDDGAYYADGQTIRFYQSGCFVGMLPPKEITKTRKMARTFLA